MMMKLLLGFVVVQSGAALLTQTRARSLVARAAVKESWTLEELTPKWGVVLEEATAMLAGGMRLNSLDPGWAVESVQDVEITKAPGLGLGLMEVANNDQGVGVVCVSELAEDGPAAKDGRLKVGDVITMVDGTNTETFTYDALIDALGSSGENVSLDVKRLVRKAKVRVKLLYPNDEEPPTEIEIYRGENLRRALLVRGVKLNDPLAQRFDNLSNGGDCGAEGTCCTCAVSVMKGGELLTDQKPQERQMLKPTPRWRLACKARVGLDLEPEDIGDLTIRVNPRQHNP